MTLGKVGDRLQLGLTPRSSGAETPRADEDPRTEDRTRNDRIGAIQDGRQCWQSGEISRCDLAPALGAGWLQRESGWMKRFNLSEERLRALHGTPCYGLLRRGLKHRDEPVGCPGRRGSRSLESRAAMSDPAALQRCAAPKT